MLPQAMQWIQVFGRYILQGPLLGLWPFAEGSEAGHWASAVALCLDCGHWQSINAGPQANCSLAGHGVLKDDSG